MNTDLDNIPENNLSTFIAELYSKYPKDIGVNKIIPIPENQEDLYDGFLIFIFEMLSEIYYEGLCHYNKLLSIINKNTIDNDIIKSLIINNVYDEFNFNNINYDILKLSENWIKSIGYFLNIYEEDYDYYLENIKENDYDLKNHYCKIILKANAKDEPYFSYANITKPYHILINSNFDNSKIKKIDDIFAIFIKNDKKDNKLNKVYKISFTEIELNKNNRCV